VLFVWLVPDGLGPVDVLASLETFILLVLASSLLIPGNTIKMVLVSVISPGVPRSEVQIDAARQKITSLSTTINCVELLSDGLSRSASSSLSSQGHSLADAQLLSLDGSFLFEGSLGLVDGAPFGMALFQICSKSRFVPSLLTFILFLFASSLAIEGSNIFHIWTMEDSRAAVPRRDIQTVATRQGTLLFLDQAFLKTLANSTFFASLLTFILLLLASGMSMAGSSHIIVLVRVVSAEVP
jgi:hypothetical protein